jgi:hypothetical protein
MPKAFVSLQAMALQKQLDLEAAEGAVPVPGMVGAPFVMTAPANVLGRLTCTVAEAKLAKNYGIARFRANVIKLFSSSNLR